MRSRRGHVDAALLLGHALGTADRTDTAWDRAGGSSSDEDDDGGVASALASRRRARERALQARDEQGRRRFHGAFTGGFVAGYNNTCGSAEGWRPREFKSSRGARCAVPQTTLDDVMDDEDKAVCALHT